MAYKTKLIICIIFFIISFILLASGILFGTLKLLPSIRQSEKFIETTCEIQSGNITTQLINGNCNKLDNNIWWTYWITDESTLCGGEDEFGGSNTLKGRNYQKSLINGSAPLGDCYQPIWKVNYLDDDKVERQANITCLWSNNLNLVSTYINYYDGGSDHICYFNEDDMTQVSWSKMSPYKISYMYTTVSITSVGGLGTIIFLVLIIIFKRKSNSVEYVMPMSREEHRLYNQKNLNSRMNPNNPIYSVNTFVYAESEYDDDDERSLI